MRKFVAVIHTGNNRTAVREHRAENAWDMLDITMKNLHTEDDKFDVSTHPITLPDKSNVEKIRVYEISGEVREFKVKPP